jgi:hypothetical protein
VFSAGIVCWVVVGRGGSGRGCSVGACGSGGARFVSVVVGPSWARCC